MPGDRELQIHQSLDMRPIDMKYPLGKVEESERGYTPNTPNTVATESTRRMFQASGASR